MKLASLRDGTRDGKLVVVTPDLNWCTEVRHIAPTLQAALDNWSEAKPKLDSASASLTNESLPRNRFRERDTLSPLPRAYQWADGSAYVNHVELVRQARGVDMPASFWTDPLMYQGGSDSFLGPRDPIIVASTEWGIDMEAEVAVIVDDVPMGVSVEAAGDHIQLVMLVNDVSLRGLIPAELGKGFGFFQSKPSSAFSPVAITPDELGTNWDGHQLHMPIRVDLNSKPFGRAHAGIDMTFNFAQLIAHAAKSRALCAGSIIGSGTVSNKLDGGPGKPIDDGGVGYSCIAELRTIETIQNGQPQTPFMQFGDTVRIEVLDSQGHSCFGAIEQAVERYEPA
ncbi:MAG: fumarylacetoacetate hydrolase family protein [Gammaproteobacteria bacterium]|nr:fumarylacetoacetate hydrolase family protein [Gammaproteobacteria bacterium]